MIVVQIESRFFRPDGTFVKEAQIAAETVGAGATWDIAFSQDDQQEFIYVADGSNMKVHVVDRDSLEVLYVLGEGGRQSRIILWDSQHRNRFSRELLYN